MGRQLSDVYTSSAWCLGDWLVYGEDAYAGRYRDAVEQTCLDYQTLRNYAWVVRQFALSRRRDSLSFGHHAEVAALPEAEQDFWLRKADEFGWSVKRLRREVRGSLLERSADVSAGDGGPEGCPGAGRPGVPGQARSGVPGQGRCVLVGLQVHLTPELLQACQAAASQAGLSVEAWAVLALDQAAQRGMGCCSPLVRER